MDGSDWAFLEQNGAGAAFDAELEASNLGFHDVSELEPLSDETWMQFVNLPTDITEESLPACQSPLLNALRSTQQNPLKRSHSPEPIGPHERCKLDTDGSIAQEHHVVTNELPWQPGNVLPAEASQGTFHTFYFSGKSAGPEERKRRSKPQLEETNKVRRLKACLPCQRAKVRVSTSLPMIPVLLLC